MKLRASSLAIAALFITGGVVHASDDLNFNRLQRIAQVHVCLNCPPNSTVCYPNTCDNHGCHVSGQACSIIGGQATRCPALPFC